MKLIVGLGNPGPKYAGTRHNVGFMVAARLAQRWSIRLEGSLCMSKGGSGMWEGHPVRLAQPQTFMNDSGEAISCLMRRFRVDPSGILIICDDVALPLGMIRMRGQGSDGGHLGLASILRKVRTEAIARLRIGIRTEGIGAAAARGGRTTGFCPEDLTAFVLGRFSSLEKKRLEGTLTAAEEACEMWVSQGVTAAMNRFNKKEKGCRI